MNSDKKIIGVSLIFLSIIFLIGIVSAENSNVDFSKVSIYYFYGDGCPHCANVAASGIMEKVQAEGVKVTKYEIYNNATNRDLYSSYADKLGIAQNDRGIPFAVIEYNGNFSYLEGDTPIIKGLESAIKNFSGVGVVRTSPNAHAVTLGAVILAGLVDSLNPCALGVLAFLMLSLLNIGSSKRALKAGIVYSFVVFFVYFLSGFGIFKVIQSFTSITHYIYIGAGVLLLVLGTIQMIDVIFPGKFISLRIPLWAKARIERRITNLSGGSWKRTYAAVFILGIIVAIFELPCTGGVYLGILSMMSVQKTFAIGYLLLYNLLFIVPLLVITFMIYKGMKPEVVQNWTTSKRGWMKISLGILMLALGIYILVSVYL